MTYIPRNWFNGDRITAERLNHIEQGIASASSGGGGGSGESQFLPVVFSEIWSEYPTCSITFDEIYTNLVENNKLPIGIVYQPTYGVDYSVGVYEDYDDNEDRYFLSFIFEEGPGVMRINIDQNDYVWAQFITKPSGFVFVVPQSPEFQEGDTVYQTWAEVMDDSVFGDTIPIFYTRNGPAYFLSTDGQDYRITFVRFDGYTSTIYEVQAPYNDSTGEYELDAPMVIVSINQPGNNTPFE